MKPRLFTIVFGSALAMAMLVPAANAQQGRPPAGPPPSGSFPGGPGPGGPSGPAAGGTGSLPHSFTRASNSAHNAVQFGPVGRWWDDKSVAKIVGLSKEQQKKMDSIFNANRPAIISTYKTFLSEQAKLQALNKNPQTDKAQLFVAIDAESKARAALQKATAQMLLQIRGQLAPEQIEKVEKLQ